MIFPGLRITISALLAMSATLAPLPAFALSGAEIDSARFEANKPRKDKGIDPFIVKAQVLLSRRSISPGVIDGRDGDNFRKAIAQFRRQEQLGEGDQIDQQTWQRLGGEDAQSIVIEYRVSKKDAAYDFAERIPKDYAKQAKMKRLSYTSPAEMFGERFHMSEELLKALNPDGRFDEADAAISVVSAQRSPEKGSARRIDVVKSTGMAVVFGENDAILASYPATIGSEDMPSLSGEHKVARIARNPDYTYNPEENFQQGQNTEIMRLPPGPNGPVGTVWIALSQPTFGIHGTPEPSKVSKTSSHGCVRLTNWDAEELAELLRPGVPVRFLD
ncbi:L,D-transpeptidase [Bosea sp. BH3]|uniref:L,D-transpeptidase family protein n=1 Tax=Bosea sp. BH3 TaxID=2871701 RepID=UPI0021CB4FC8|nr:L,D-transpeptidase [Bosea sp. BH3]